MSYREEKGTFWQQLRAAMKQAWRAPELRVRDNKVEQATFNLDLSFYGGNHGAIKVVCLKDVAEFAAGYVYPGFNLLVVGHLIRGSWQSGETTWWEEITLAANYLERIEQPRWLR
jgi:hypothetical protein